MAQPWARLANFLGRAHPQPSLRVVPQKKISLKNPDKGGWPSPGPDWPISWGEHTLSPGLRVVHQKKILPSKVQTRVDGPALGQTDRSSGESARSALVRR